MNSRSMINPVATMISRTRINAPQEGTLMYWSSIDDAKACIVYWAQWVKLMKLVRPMMTARPSEGSA